MTLTESVPCAPLAPLEAEGLRPMLGNFDVVQAWLGDLKGRSVLDVGCGRGAFARTLVAEGVKVTGVDPLAEAVEEARAAVPEGDFQVAGAEALPFADQSFDVVVIVNALHHVPGPLMETALKEAARVSRGPVLVIEPLAAGTFFEAMRPVEDETEIRTAAQAALADAVASGVLRLDQAGEYDSDRRFKDLDAFLARVVSVDPARADAAIAARDEVAELYTRWGTPEDDMMVFSQPHRAHLLHRA